MVGFRCGAAGSLEEEGCAAEAAGGLVVAHDCGVTSELIEQMSVTVEVIRCRFVAVQEVVLWCTSLC